MLRFIRLNENNVVIATRIGKEIVDGEIQSEVGECGQIRQQDGTFIYPESIPVVSTEEQLTMLQENQLILMDAIATLYEDLVLGGV